MQLQDKEDNVLTTITYTHTHIYMQLQDKEENVLTTILHTIYICLFCFFLDRQLSGLSPDMDQLAEK